MPGLLLFLAVLIAVAWQAIAATSRTDAPESDDRSPLKYDMFLILTGAFVGPMLLLIVGPLLFEPGVSFTGILLTIVTMCITLLLLWPWIENGRLPRAVPPIATVAILINLLAAGGISVPGVATTLWLLLAIIVTSAGRDREIKLTWKTGLPIFLLILLPLAAGSFLSCKSHLHSRLTLRLTNLNSDYVRSAEKAARIDPNAIEPRQSLFAIRMQQWMQSPNESNWKALQNARAELIRVNPQSSNLREFIADQEAAGFIMTRDAGLGELAKQDFEQAIRFYPNNARLRGNAAIFHHELGDDEGLELHGRQALQLDSQTPHADQKLAPEVRDTLNRLLPKN